MVPRQYGKVNWIGLWTLYTKEVHRFLKVFTQTVAAPVVTTFLFYAVFALALGGMVRTVGDMPFLVFLAPGLIMMSMVQNAFANTSSSLMISKYDGTIVDILMPPLTPAELACGKILGGVTRGLAVGLATGAVMAFFTNLGLHSLFYILAHAVLGSMLLSSLGLAGGIWAEKFDHIAAMTNFIITPMTFLSGTFYSIQSLPPRWHSLAMSNPFFYMIDGFRYGFTGHADGNLMTGLIVMVGCNIALWIACLAMLSSGYKIKN